MQEGFGTSDVATERTLTYSANDMLATLKDAENNLTTFEYDGFDRWSKTRYPVPAKGGNASSTTDYEQALAYDANSSVTSFRNRAGQAIGFGYDNLGRVKSKDLPGTEPDVAYGYDNLGRLTSASQTGNALSFTYDALGRNLTQVGPQGTATSAWDLAGRRTQLTYPGTGLYVNYDYLVTGDVIKVRENGAVSGVGVLATYAYDNLGNRTSLTFGNGVVQVYTFDPVSRLASLSNNLSGTTNDLTINSIAYSPASQIASTVRTGDAYAWTGHGNGSTGFTQNGLNQQITIGGVAATWDTKGNLTSEPQSGKTYGYSSENLLTSATGGVTLGYDPALRLYQVVGTATTRFAYDGVNAIAEYNGSNALQRRYVFGSGVDAPLVQYEGTGTTDRRFMSADERGSIISLTDSAGALLNINAYDEYGKPQSTNAGRFQYTGQMWIGDASVYDYHYRDYVPQLGIFAQTDPVRYDGDGPNLYAYVLDDPVNLMDPTGTSIVWTPVYACVAGNCAWTGYFKWVPDLPSPVGGNLFGDTVAGALSEPSNAPAQQRTSCSQRGLDLANGLKSAGESFNKAGDQALIGAGAVAVAGAAFGATGIGLPAGVTAEAAAGGLAAAGAVTKGVGSFLSVGAHVVAIGATGNYGYAGPAIFYGVAGILPLQLGPAASFFQDKVADIASTSIGFGSIPQQCEN